MRMNVNQGRGARKLSRVNVSQRLLNVLQPAVALVVAAVAHVLVPVRETLQDAFCEVSSTSP